MKCGQFLLFYDLSDFVNIFLSITCGNCGTNLCYLQWSSRHGQQYVGKTSLPHCLGTVYSVY